VTVTGSPISTGEADRRRRRTTWRRIALESAVLLLLILGVDLYAIRYASAEHTLYRADQLAYWTYSSRLADDLRDDAWSAVQAIAWSVANSDLNLLPAAPVALVLTISGSSRADYLLAVLTVYGVALVAALLMAIRMAVPDRFEPRTMAVIASSAGALLLFPTAWKPVFIGYLGLGGVALGLVILAVYFRGTFADDGWERLALVGFLLALLALFRRWYTLWSVAFAIVVVVDTVWEVSSRRGLRFGRAVRTPLIIGGVALASLLAMAAPITFQRLGAGYREEFAAFTHHGGFAGRLAAVVGEFGLLPLLVFAGSTVFLALRPRTRRMAVLLPLQAVLTYLLMIRVQDHSPHHWYLYLAVFLMLTALAAMRVIGERPRRAGVMMSIVLLGVGLLTTAGVFAVSAEPVANVLGPILPRSRVRPALRTDIGEVRRLLAYLDDRTSHRPGWIYVLGCSGTLSEQTLAFANRSLGTSYSSPGLILQSANVDRRDGFPSMLLEATYVVVPDPVQINMRPEDQRVVVMPTESFLEGRDLARAYRRLPEVFRLEVGVEVSVFERFRPPEPEEIRELSDRLREAYPDRPDIFRPR